MGVGSSIGSLEGRYVVGESIWSEGPVHVYEGKDNRTGGDIEIRMLESEADDASRRRFGQQAQLIARLDHPGCLHAVSNGSTPDGTLYLVVNGSSPHRLSGRQKLETAHAADVAAQLLRAIDHVLSQGIRIRPPKLEDVDERIRGNRLEVRLVEYRIVDGEPGVDDEVEHMCHVGRLLERMVRGSARRSAEGSSSFLPSTAGSDGELLYDTFDRLVSEDASHRFASLSDAAEAIEYWCRANPPKAAPEKQKVDQSASAEFWRSATSITVEGDVLDMPAVPPAAEPRSSGRMFIAGAAAVAAIGIAAAVFVSRKPSAPPTGSAATVTGSASVSSEMAPQVQNVNEPETVDSQKWLEIVNRHDIDMVPSYDKRHEMLRRLVADPKLADGVDLRWNAIVDLVQHTDAKSPCATFERSLDTVSEEPLSEDERAILADVKVPTAPAGDDSCDGLADRFEDLLADDGEQDEVEGDDDAPSARARARKRGRLTKGKPKRDAVETSAPTPQEQPATAPAAVSAELPTDPAKKKQPPKKRGSVASPLEDDIKAANF